MAYGKKCGKGCKCKSCNKGTVRLKGSAKKAQTRRPTKRGR